MALIVKNVGDENFSSGHAEPGRLAYLRRMRDEVDDPTSPIHQLTVSMAGRMPRKIVYSLVSPC
jgi:hypothetical protein